MTRKYKLSNVKSVLAELPYPIEKPTAADELSDVTVRLADGEENLGELVSRTASDTFESAEDVETEIHNVLPREAVGEPYQSEGEG